MAWAKLSDKAHSHAALATLKAIAGDDEALALEVWGYFHWLGSWTAQHLTDMVITEPTLRAEIPRSRFDKVMDAFTRSGLLTRIDPADGWERYQMLDDEDGLLHVKTRLEVEIDRRRSRDTSNPALTAAVKLRDGDACRYCGLIVSWSNTGSGKRATYDHLVPDGALEPTKAEQMVVACDSCNSKLKDMPYGERQHLLLRAPSVPYYKRSTLAFFAKHQVALPERYEKNETRWQPATETMASSNTTPVSPDQAGVRGTDAVGTPVDSDPVGARGCDAAPSSPVSPDQAGVRGSAPVVKGSAATAQPLSHEGTPRWQPATETMASSNTTPVSPDQAGVRGTVAVGTPVDSDPVGARGCDAALDSPCDRAEAPEPKPPSPAGMHSFVPAQAMPGHRPGIQGQVPGFLGSGRDGQVRAGTGSAAGAPAPPPSPASRVPAFQPVMQLPFRRRRR